MSKHSELIVNYCFVLSALINVYVFINYSVNFLQFLCLKAVQLIA
jgi:hypothetical protein